MVEIESPAEADLDDRDFDARAAEQLERDGGGRFEEGRMDRQIAGLTKAVGAVEHVVCGALEPAASTGSVPMTNRSGQVDKMRRHVSRRADAGRDERRMHHGRHGTLAVGAGDVKRRKRPFGMVERGAQARDVVETELDAERLEREETVEQLQRCSASTAAATAIGGWGGAGAAP